MQILDSILGLNRLGLISDFDGVLSPIVSDRDAAQMTAPNREIMGKLTEKLTFVAVVSGRGVADLQTRVNLPNVVYVGNHGLERWQDGAVIPVPAAQPFRPALEKLRDQVNLPAGVELEDKGATFSIHFRNAQNPDSADALGEELAQLSQEYGLKFFMGKKVYEIRPPIEVNKGTALADLVKDYALEAAICLGDDTTDVDMFKTLHQLREHGICQGLAIGVDTPETPSAVREAADLLVEGVSGIETCLNYVLERRAS